MTRAEKQEVVPETKAEYADSQALLDAFRTAFVRVGEQRAQLSVARDILQQLQFDQPDPTSQKAIERHEDYVDCAVRAWRSATEIYADIFHAVARVTAASTKTSMELRHRQAELKQMARACATIKRTAFAFELFEKARMAEGGAETNEHVDVEMKDSSDAHEVGDESDDVENPDEHESEDHEDSSPGSQSDDSYEPEDQEPVDDITTTNPILLHLLGKPPITQGDKQVRNVGTNKPDASSGTVGGSRAKKWKVEKNQQSQEKKRTKRVEHKYAEKARDAVRAQGLFEATFGPTNEEDYISLSAGMERVPKKQHSRTVPHVQYEDVSAEVDARIKAKEDEKKAAKERKKRKRESGDSFEGGQTATKAEKPKKKKSKSEGSNVDVDARGPTMKDKKHRRESEDDQTANIEYASRKKRKKSKE